MSVIVGRADSHGVDLELTLDRSELLPGTLVDGHLAMTSNDGTSIRSVQAVLRATEHWQYERTTPRAGGGVQTETVTKREELRRVPVALSGRLVLEPGRPVELPVELPVPPLGPATLEGTVSGLTWEVEIEINRPRGFDPGLVVPVRVLQPTALLRAGVVHVGAFALYEAADSAVGEASASLSLKPMPICIGAPVDGLLEIEMNRALDLQEIRLEIRVAIEATVSSGCSEEITLLVAPLAGPGRLEAGTYDQPFRLDVPAQWLPTIELPHGRAQASCHVILARAFARDPHLVRDLTICSTTEM
jgi:hypothetical protein